MEIVFQSVLIFLATVLYFLFCLGVGYFLGNLIYNWWFKDEI